jgi:hypothetical protein
MSRLPQSPSAEDRPLRRGERGRARRRLRYLRQVRELQLRDLGGFVLDLYRFGRQRDRRVRAKLDAIIATDKETHGLEARLDQRQRGREVRQPGVGGACPSCGDLHASDARFCAHCGVALTKARDEVAPAEAAQLEPEPEGAPEEPAVAEAEPEAEAAMEAAMEAVTAADATSAAEPPADEPGWPEPDPAPRPAEAVELDSVRRRRRARP